MIQVVKWLTCCQQPMLRRQSVERPLFMKALFVMLANTFNVKLANMTGLPMMIPLLIGELMVVLPPWQTWN